eukprot:23334_1
MKKLNVNPKSQLKLTMEVPVFVNDRILTTDFKSGIVRFIGTVGDKDEYYYGLQLLGQEGKNNGSYKSIPYFAIKSNKSPNSGLFVKRNRIQAVISCKTSLGCIIGDRVYVKKVKSFGIIQYIGKPKDEKTIKLGIKLEKSSGTTNGSYNNIQYFRTKRGYAHFCGKKDIRTDSAKKANKIIKNRIKKCQNLTSSDIGLQEEKYDETLPHIQLGDKVEINRESVQIIGIVIHLHCQIDIDVIWRSDDYLTNTRRTVVEYKDIIRVRPTLTIHHALSYNDVIFCTESNSFAVVKGVKLTQGTINVNIYQVPEYMAPTYDSIDTLQREFGLCPITEYGIRKEMLLTEMKYRKLDKHSYSEQIKPIITREIKKRNEIELKQWAENEWIHGKDVSVRHVEEKNEYVITFREGVSTMLLCNPIPSCKMSKWKIKVKHLNEESNVNVFFGVFVGNDYKNKTYDLYCGDAQKRQIRHSKVTIEDYDANGKFWRDGANVTHVWYEEVHSLEFKTIQGVFNKNDEYLIRKFDEINIKTDDEYLFEMNNATLTVYMDGNIVHTSSTNGDRYHIHPIISFKSNDKETDNKNIFIFSFC